MESRRVSTSIITLNAEGLHPRFITDLSEDRFSIAILDRPTDEAVYLDGTLDELAKFVQDLANVVREINTRELTVTS